MHFLVFIRYLCVEHNGLNLRLIPHDISSEGLRQYSGELVRGPYLRRSSKFML